MDKLDLAVAFMVRVALITLLGAFTIAIVAILSLRLRRSAAPSDSDVLIAAPVDSTRFQTLEERVDRLEDTLKALRESR